MTHDTGLCIVTVSVCNAGPPKRGVPCTAELNDVAAADLARVSEISKIEPDQLRGRGREPEIVAARWAWWALLRDRGMSYSRIARIVGCDHSSVISAIRLAPDRDAVQALLVALRE
jgi:hypothetical protein